MNKGKIFVSMYKLLVKIVQRIKIDVIIFYYYFFNDMKLYIKHPKGYVIYCQIYILISII